MTIKKRVVFDITSKDLVFAIKKQKRTEKKVSYMKGNGHYNARKMVRNFTVLKPEKSPNYML